MRIVQQATVFMFLISFRSWNPNPLNEVIWRFQMVCTWVLLGTVAFFAFQQQRFCGNDFIELLFAKKNLNTFRFNLCANEIYSACTSHPDCICCNGILQLGRQNAIAHRHDVLCALEINNCPGWTIHPFVFSGKTIYRLRLHRDVLIKSYYQYARFV